MIEVSQNIRDYITSLYGSDMAEKYFEFIKTDHSPYIRINPLSIKEDVLLSRLKGYGVKLEKVPLLDFAYKVLEGGEILGKTLEYNLGKYYIQSLSSMIPPIVLNPTEKDLVLDLCSAPGSKATEMAEMMGNKGTLVTNEPALERIKMLVHNLDKMNLVNMGVIQYKGEWLSRVYNDYFDKILVDAPCSALGVIQKKEEVSNWWSIERAEKIAYHQMMIITAAIKMAKIGGEIVYSTCTLTPEENELIINHVLKKYPLEVMDIELPLKSYEGFTVYRNEQLDPGLSKARRILPWEVDSEGFFVVKLKKTGRTEPAKPLELKNDSDRLLSYKDKSVFKYLMELSDTFGIEEDEWKGYSFMLKANDIFFINMGWRDDNPGFFTRVGTQLSTIDKRDHGHLYSFAAQHFNSKITKNIFEISNERQLKDYLSGGIIRTGEVITEQKVIKYNDLTLGTAAPVSNGLKSQYPKSKRIHEISFF